VASLPPPLSLRQACVPAPHRQSPHAFLSLLLAVALGLCGPRLAVADAVVVTGTREPLPAVRLVADVVVIDRERIASSLADSLEDLLRREAGLQLSRNGGPGANNGLFVRGAASGQTLLLVDGVRFGAATTGLPEFEALALAAVDRIEVLRGPASSLYGADAVGGVVQVFTRRGSGSPAWRARVAVGGYGAREASAAVSGAAGAFDLAASVAGDRNDGVSALRPDDTFGNHNPDRDGYSRRNATLQVGWSPLAGHRVSLQALASRLNAQYDASEFLPPTFAQDNSADFRNRLESGTAALHYRGTIGQGLVLQARVADQRSRLDSGGRSIDRFRTGRRQAELQLAWNLAEGQTLTLAADRLHERARSTRYAADAERDHDAFVLAWAGGAGPLVLQAEWRRDDDSQYGGVGTGRFGAAWPLPGGWRLRALAATTFRAPSFNDLYFPGYGVPTLRPERGRSLEAGASWRQGNAEAAFTLFRGLVRELIAYEPDRRHCPPGFEYDFGCARNIGRARLQGASLGGAWRTFGLHWRGRLDLLDATDSDTGSRLTRRAAHQAMLAAEYRRADWSAAAELLRVGARPEGGRMLAAATTLDLRAACTLAPSWQVEARLLNATGRDIEPALDYRGLGRQAWLGLRFQGRGG